MKSYPLLHFLSLIILTLFLTCCFSLPGRADETPFQEKWAPSVFGPDDQVGSLNWIGSQKVLDSLKLVKRGKVVTLGKVYQSDIPYFGKRNWKLIIPGLPTGRLVGDNSLLYNDEYVFAELGQVGTQFDGLGHIGVHTSKGDFFYNGNFLEEFGTSYGLNKLGVEKLGEVGYVTRGIILDVAGYRGVDRLPIPQGKSRRDPGIITVADIRGTNN